MHRFMSGTHHNINRQSYKTQTRKMCLKIRGGLVAHELQRAVNIHKLCNGQRVRLLQDGGTDALYGRLFRPSVARSRDIEGRLVRHDGLYEVLGSRSRPLISI